KHERKTCWFDCHRRFLPPDHPYRGFVSLRKNSTGIPMRRSLSITTSSIKLWTTMGSRYTSGRRSGKSTRLFLIY
ncbi:unnamed protein product, partial [Brassica oleracea var. botrytis]